ncbi:MAG: ArsR family transcriptional regulator [Symbiobacterium sp.]|uniref:ArsR family transcriptional regulator n=1 Tax=Symbiobacterium sp. TaxID=1971213 RepID=UPI003463E047
MVLEIRPGQVKVPGTVILDRRLTPVAKVVWAGLQLKPRSKRELAAFAGLSLSGLNSGLNVLRQFGLCEVMPVCQSCDCSAVMPVDLLRTDLSAQAKVLYATFQLLPGFRESIVEVTYDQLCFVTDTCLNTVKRALEVLRLHGWIEIARPGRYGSFFVTVSNPHLESQMRAIAELERRLEKEPYRGEGLMRELLNLTVDSQDFEDNAWPGFLINPLTCERLQVDRLYFSQAVGFEFNGPQHYGPTALYPDEEAARLRQARDLIKLAICHQRGILLVPVHSQDLSVSGILRLIPDRLPLRCLDGQELLIAHLEDLCKAYRRRAPLPLPVKKRALDSTPTGNPGEPSRPVESSETRHTRTPLRGMPPETPGATARMLT